MRSVCFGVFHVSPSISEFACDQASCCGMLSVISLFWTFMRSLDLIFVFIPVCAGDFNVFPIYVWFLHVSQLLWIVVCDQFVVVRVYTQQSLNAFIGVDFYLFVFLSALDCCM
jgi:hypothetical protein